MALTPASFLSHPSPNNKPFGWERGTWRIL